MKTMKAFFILLFAVLFVGCSSDEESDSAENSERIVYTSLYPLQYIVEQIATDTVQVNTVFPPGADAHTYEPSSRDMTAIAESDAFIYVGAGMEAFAETAADSLVSQSVELIEIGEHEELFMESDHGHDHGEDHHHHGDYDPHIWLDPTRMIKMAEIIKEELIALYPENEARYNENFEKLEATLTELDEAFMQVLNEKEEKHIVVSHASFGYWEERYGIEQISILGLSTENEPSQKELTQIIDEVEERNLEYILFEQNSSNRVAQVIQDEAGLEAVTIHTLEVLTEEDIANEEDYISIMEQNLEVLDQVTR